MHSHRCRTGGFVGKRKATMFLQVNQCRLPLPLVEKLDDMARTFIHSSCSWVFANGELMTSMGVDKGRQSAASVGSWVTAIRLSQGAMKRFSVLRCQRFAQ